MISACQASPARQAGLRGRVILVDSPQQFSFAYGALTPRVAVSRGLVEVASREELVGSDVIVVHRLLKNHVEESTGFSAYVLYTASCVAAMGLDDPAGGGLVEHRETFDGVGEVVGWVRDLHGAWDEELAGARIVVTPDDAARVVAAVYDAPPAIVWDYVTSPARRIQWQYGVTGIETVEGTAGRRGAGTVNHCIHGKDAIVEEVMDWRPYDYVTYRSQMPIPNTPKLLNTFALDDLGDGRTRLEMRFGRPRSARDRAIAETILPMVDDSIRHGLEALRPLIEAAAAAAPAAVDADEPDLPVAQGRNLREPVIQSVS